MGLKLKGGAAIFVAIVTIFGLLIYGFQRSKFEFHWMIPGQQSENGATDCNDCQTSKHSMLNLMAREKLKVTVDSASSDFKSNENTAKALFRLGPYTPPSSPCNVSRFSRLTSSKNTDILSPGPFIKESKNPCWWSVKHPRNSPRLRCLPYFFLAGVSKCGSTDIFSRLMGHPQIVVPGSKEPSWFDWRRFVSDDTSFTGYVSNFQEASWEITQDIDRTHVSRKIVGDGSPTYIWRNFHWQEYAGNEGCIEPRIVIPDIIGRSLPHAKIIISFRDPVSSLYSKYLSEADKGKFRSPKHFHDLVVREIERYRQCFAHSTVRACAYNITLSKQVQVRLEKGLYVVYLSDWLRVFPWKQFLIVRFEDYIKDIGGHLQRMFRFLDLDAVSEEALHKLKSLPPFHPGKHYHVGQMLPSTRRMLQQFYAPFNAQLAHLLKDRKFLWQSQ